MSQRNAARSVEDECSPRRFFRVELTSNLVPGTSSSSTSSSIATASRRVAFPASSPTASSSAAAPPTPAITSSHTATRSCSLAHSRAAIIEDKQWNNCEGNKTRICRRSEVDSGRLFATCSEMAKSSRKERIYWKMLSVHVNRFD